MSEFQLPIEGGNSGDGSPLILGDDSKIGDTHSPCDPTTTVRVLDWDGGGFTPEVAGGST